MAPLSLYSSPLNRFRLASRLFTYPHTCVVFSPLCWIVLCRWLIHFTHRQPPPERKESRFAFSSSVEREKCCSIASAWPHGKASESLTQATTSWRNIEANAKQPNIGRARDALNFSIVWNAITCAHQTPNHTSEWNDALDLEIKSAKRDIFERIKRKRVWEK